MLRLSIGVVESHLSAPSTILAEIENRLTFTVQDYCVGLGMFPRQVCLLQNNRFPAGLSAHVVQWISSLKTEEKLEIQIEETAWSCELSGFLDGLWPNQVIALKELSKHKRAVLESPTGSGKSRIICTLSQVLQGNTLIIVPTKELAAAALEGLKKFHSDVGLIGDSVYAPERVTVGIVNSVASLAKNESSFLASVDNLIFDECHRAHAPMYQAVGAAAKHTTVRYGLTGTLPDDPYKMAAVIGLIGPVAVQITEANLVQQGAIRLDAYWQVPVEPVSPYYPTRYNRHTKKWNTPNGKPVFTEVEDLQIARNSHRARVAAQIIAAFLRWPERSGNALIFFQKYSQSDILLDAIAEEGISLERIGGVDTKKRRQQTLKGLQDGSISCIVCSTIYNEGVDIPGLQLGIIATDSANPITLRQQVGRIVRVGPAKSNWVIDLCCPNEQHYLKRRAIQRAQIIKDRFGLDRCEQPIPFLPTLERWNPPAAQPGAYSPLLTN